MRLILTPGEGLNAQSCDRLLTRLAAAPSTDAVTVDLGSAAFVDPYGAALLLMVARQLHRRRQPLICVLPGQERPLHACAGIGLLDALRPIAELRNLSQPAAAKAIGVLPVTPIRSQRDVQAVVAFMVEMTRDRLGYTTGDGLDTAKVISELCNNVVDHSDGEGVVLAQVGSDRRGGRYVALAVADDGIGIRSSLARRFPEAARWRDADAIGQALDGLSSRSSGGGVGLRSVTAVVRRYLGRLSMRSGADRVYISANRLPRTLAGASFPGTLVGISFSQRA
jgi:hypothetical protein